MHDINICMHDFKGDYEDIREYFALYIEFYWFNITCEIFVFNL